MNEATVTTLQAVFRLAGPEAVLVGVAFVVFLAGAFGAGKALAAGISFLGLLASAALLMFDPPTVERLQPTISVLWQDSLALYTRILAWVGCAVLLWASWDELDDDQAADYYACLLILAAGTALIGSASELITLFLALELVSMPTYVMIYLPRVGKPVQEAAVKYFLLSIFSSALLLFGFSYLYGVTGTTNVPAIHEALTRGEATPLPGVLMVAAVMVIAGLGFRVTAVPFHFYAPDVYQGAANCTAALLAFIPKVAGFVAIVRLFGLVGPGPIAGNALQVGTQLPLLFWILAAVTMTVGNVFATLQTDVKRMLAYSSIAHSGYMLMGLAAAPYLALLPEGNANGVAAILFYLPAYGAMTIGAFAVLQAVSTSQRPISKIDDLAGLSGTHPGLALAMALFLFSLIGLPLTAGFMGKFLLFMSVLSVPAVPPEQDWMFKVLAVVAAVNAAIGAYYYLRVIGTMYLRTAIKPLPGRAGAAGILAIAVCAALTIWLGCYPPQVVGLARTAAKPTYPAPHLRAAN